MAPAAVEEWSLDDVLAMLDGLNLGHLQQPFKENGVNGRLLVTMHEAEFQEVWSGLGYRLGSALAFSSASRPPAPIWVAAAFSLLVSEAKQRSLLAWAIDGGNVLEQSCGRACGECQHSRACHAELADWAWVRVAAVRDVTTRRHHAQLRHFSSVMVPLRAWRGILWLRALLASGTAVGNP